ncbi:MAG: hypothetical protein R3C03_22340 [Pirellulaceae bacterium]
MIRLLVPFWLACLLFECCLLSASPLQVEQSSATRDQPLIDGLRRRQLFDLADYHCEQLLATNELAVVDRTAIVIEKMKTQMARAIQVQGNGRMKAWDEAVRIGDDFAAAETQNPRLPLVAIQSAMVQMAESRLLAAENRISPLVETSRDRAVSQLRGARRRLEDVERTLTTELPQSPTESGTDGTFSNREIHSLLANVRFQIAQSNLTRAAMYAVDDRVNRIDALTGVVSWLNETLKQVDPNHPLNHSTKLRLAEAYRMLGDYREAQAQLASLPENGMTFENQQAAIAEQLDLGIATNDLMRFRPVLELAKSQSESAPETDLAALRFVLALASQSDSNGQWQQAASDWINRIEQRHGLYWGRLAERTFVNQSNQASALSGSDTSNDMAERLGDTAARDERWDDAANAYRKALDQSIAAGDWDNVFEQQFKRIKALEQLGDTETAVSELLDVARKRPEHAMASTAHLRAAWYVAQQAATDKSQVDRFRDLLVEHLRDWPAATTAAQARLWLARLQLGNKDYQAAIENYFQIPARSTLFVEVAKDLQFAIPGLLATRSELDSRAQLAGQLMRGLKSLITPADVEQASSSDLLLVVSLDKLASEFDGEDSGVVARLAERNLATVESLSSLQLSQQAAVAIAFLAEQGNEQGRARELFEEIKAEPTGMALLYELLSLRNRRLRNTEIEGWQLRVAAELESSADSEREKSHWRLQQAQVYLNNGKPDEALAKLNAMVGGDKSSDEVTLLKARCLAAIPGKELESLDEWRRVASRSQDHSEVWFEAKYEVARLLLETDQKAEAAKLLRYMKAVPPGWEQSSRKADFDALMERCGADDPPR